MVIDRQLVIALGKGRLFPETTRAFDRIGYDMEPVRTALDERKMMAEDGTGRLRFLFAKDADVPVFVEHGAADIGIAGRDVLWENDVDVFVPLLLGDLIPTSRCRLVLAGPRAWQDRKLQLAHDLRIATKYPAITREYLWQRGLSAEVTGLRGNIELAPAAGLSDLIVDITQTGTTLRENDLVILDTILRVEACLIVNRASQKLRPDDVREIVELLETLTPETVDTAIDA